MSEEWVTDAMRKIDVNHDNYLSYVYFSRKKERKKRIKIWIKKG
jgi:hypothetical protein